MRPLKYFFYIILQKKAMKRLFPILILLLSQVSCTNQYVQSSQEISESVRAKLALITKSACDDLIKGIVVADVESFLLGQLNLQKEEIDSINRIDLSADAYFYVVNIKGGGWFFISGDYSSGPILASGESGSFQTGEHLSRHDRLWFNSIREYINDCKQSNSEEVNRSRNTWIRVKRLAKLSSERKAGLQRRDIDTTEVDIQVVSDTLIYENYPSLTVTNWTQDSPWNNNVPKFNSNDRCLAGCTVVAVAQLLYYTHYAFGFPNDIYENATCNNYYYDTSYTWTFSNPTTTSWDLMSIEEYNANTYFDPYMPALCALIAKRSNTKYGYDPDVAFDYTETYGSTQPDTVPVLLASFMLAGASKQSYSTVTSPDIIINEIKHNRPVLCAGLSNPNETSAHAFLIDGYYRYKFRETETIKDMQGNILSQEEYIYDYFYWRINTGNPINRINDYIWNSTYYPSSRIFFVGWSQN